MRQENFCPFSSFPLKSHHLKTIINTFPLFGVYSFCLLLNSKAIMSTASVSCVWVSTYVESNPIKQADRLRFRSLANNSISRTFW